jgi:GTP-binding protein HflX
LLEHSHKADKVILVYVSLTGSIEAEDFDEFKELALSAGADIVGCITSIKKAPSAQYFVGSGKALEIQALVEATNAELVLFNQLLTPAQERNLERLCKCRVLERTGLILDIFAQRARTFEGKLQVELAQLQHLATRLVRGWTHLERQKGGIGLRGPGETQLETDRRLLRQRVKVLAERLEKVRIQRDQGRRARQKALIPTVSIVGYTNAGKSTLFNRLTDADIYTANQLFATLDPTIRRISLPNASDIIVTDTVGFIRDLPPDLVAAFRATLEEVTHASLILHVVDAHDPNLTAKMAQVEKVLQELKAEQIPQLVVYNKIDLLEDNAPKLQRFADGNIERVWLSAQTGLGLDILQQAVAERLFGEPVYRRVSLTPQQARLRSELYKMHAVLSEDTDEMGNYLLSIRLTKADFARLFQEKN